MSEHSSELNKLTAIVTDPEFSAELRIKAIESVGRIGSREALLVLLDLAAREDLNCEERDLALQLARGIIKSGR